MKKVIGEKRPYNARPVPRSAEDKKKYFEKLVKAVNLYGPRKKGFDDLLSFVSSNKEYKDLVMFRRVKINEQKQRNFNRENQG